MPETAQGGAEPERKPRSRWVTGVLFTLLLVPWLLVPVGVVLAGLGITGFDVPALDWFDPYFLHYNIFLSLLAVLIVPAIVGFYRGMDWVKVRRLRQEMTEEEWQACSEEVHEKIERRFRLRSYLGSLLAAMLVISAGAAIMLLMKPYFPAEAPEGTPAMPERGVNFGWGANILMAGPFVKDHSGGTSEDLERFYTQVAVGLTAFQFGFLGAYIYFIGSLLRSYFTLDLSSHTLVAGTIRMLTSSVLALVLSFVLPAVLPGDVSDPEFLRALPVIAFFLGYFPNRGLLWLERWGDKMLGLGPKRYEQTPLGRLAGMNAGHETRLEREGYDNVENLAYADALDLAVRTGFGYRQLRAWIGEARLRSKLGADYDAFVEKTWLRTEDQVVRFYEAWEDPATGAHEHLAAACPEMESRIRDLGVLLGRP